MNIICFKRITYPPPEYIQYDQVDMTIYDFKKVEFEDVEKWWLMLDIPSSCPKNFKYDPLPSGATPSGPTNCPCERKLPLKSYRHVRNAISDNTLKTIHGFLHQSNRSKKQQGDTMTKIKAIFSKFKSLYLDSGFEINCENSFERLIYYMLAETLGLKTEVLTREGISRVSYYNVKPWKTVEKAIKAGKCGICPNQEFKVLNTEWDDGEMYYIILGQVKCGVRFSINEQNKQDFFFLLLTNSDPFCRLGKDVLHHIVSFI